MKKILIVLYTIFLSFTVLASEYTNKKEYTIEKKNIYDVPEVMNFFSFFCPYCYKLEKIYKIHHLLKNKIDQKIKKKNYHVNFLGGNLGKTLTKAWIIAQKMKVEEKIMLPIFQGIQETNTINNAASIKDIFLKEAGVNSDKYNKFWNSFTLKILIRKNNQDVKKAKLNYVPSMLINGKYLINYFKLEKIFKKDFSKKYINLLYFLIKK
ncbi:DsbA family protein [Buchnera aphidicola]|uniref:DsbA family protein n=1 Tax=Buchnera aphidicola TaxID=9 RepID=UPI003464D86C